MTIHNCDLCGSAVRAPIAQSEKYGSGGVCVCLNCGFVYVPERRSSKEIADTWDAIYRPEGEPIYDAAWPAVKARLFYVAEQYGDWEGKSVLEIGAGQGVFLEMIRERGAHPVGLDPSAQNCQILRSKDIFAHHGTIESCGTVGSFDVVVILWTLENCQDCIAMLKRAWDNLREGGDIIVATGSRILVPFKKRLSHYFSDTPPDTHCFRFSQYSLEAALLKSGFADLKFNDYENLDWLMAVAKKSCPNPRTCPDPPRRIPERVMDYFNEWERLFP